MLRTDYLSLFGPPHLIYREHKQEIPRWSIP
jgi:hypothetical protein